MSGDSVLPPPGHAFWRAPADEVAEATHRTIANLEAEYREAVTRAQSLSEVCA